MHEMEPMTLTLPREQMRTMLAIMSHGSASIAQDQALIQSSKLLAVETIVRIGEHSFSDMADTLDAFSREVGNG
jgi:hypothetical protein